MIVFCRLIGSPPRVRGTGDQWRHGKFSCRITPACAGNRLIHDLSQFVSWDHPRVCGEQPSKIRIFSFCTGSPPRVRGTAIFSLLHMLSLRITPACAGNSISPPGASGISQDHPRVCGEQILLPFHPPSLVGSPPRVRGTVIRPRFIDRRLGITPACAGNRIFYDISSGII